MGKRSRMIEARRERQRFLEHLGRQTRLMNALKLEFCWKVAAFDDHRGYEAFGFRSSITWLSSIFQMTEAEAANCISLGRHLAASDARRTAHMREAPNAQNPPV